jgi:hypothetical protein
VNTGKSLVTTITALSVVTALGTAGYIIANKSTISDSFENKGSKGNLVNLQLRQTITTGTLTTGAVRVLIFTGGTASGTAGDELDLGSTFASLQQIVDLDTWVDLDGLNSIATSGAIELPVWSPSNGTTLDVIPVSKDANWTADALGSVKIVNVIAENN